MRRSALFGTVVAALVLGVAAVSIARTAKVTEPERVVVIEHADTDVVTDTGQAGDTAGDLLTFANPVYDAANEEQVGRDQGDCVRIDPADGKWECRWITWVGGGALTVEGPFYDTKDSVMAITGGTGRYNNARGSMTLHAISPTEFRFTFDIKP
jgi:allene oxide cyclase